MDGAIDFAIASEAPALTPCSEDVYAPGEPSRNRVRTRIARVLARE